MEGLTTPRWQTLAKLGNRWIKIVITLIQILSFEQQDYDFEYSFIHCIVIKEIICITMNGCKKIIIQTKTCLLIN